MLVRLFAALNVLDGTVLGRCMQRCRHQEFLRFLNTIEGRCAGKVIHVILNDYSSHKHPKVLRSASCSTSRRPRTRDRTRSRP
jgi:hypothetical protein